MNTSAEILEDRCLLTPIAVENPLEDLLISTEQTRRVAEGLSQPLFVTAPPGDFDRLFIAGKPGEIRILDRASGSLLAEPFLDLPDDNISTNVENGLAGLAFHPDFANNGWFYVNYTDANGTNILERYEVSEDDPNRADPESRLTILTLPQPGPNHNLGWLGFGPDGYLYIGSGDGRNANDPDNAAQNLNDLHGKILRIDVDGGDDFSDDDQRNYAIPPDNPFVNQDGADEVWAYGLRNPWRPSFDSETGDLYIADVGQRAREEVNFQHASSSGGENYGWRPREGLIPTPGVGEPTPPGVVDPIYDYTRGNGPFEGNSVTGGYVYRGPIADLHGHYIFGDFGSGQIWSLQVDRETGQMVDGSLTDLTTRFRPDAGEIGLISSFGEDPDGNLYIVDLAGEVFQLVPDFSDTLIFDLADVFSDAESNNTYLIQDNTGPLNVRTQIVGTVLTVSFLRATTDPIEITILAIDPGGESAADTFEIRFDIPPLLAVGAGLGQLPGLAAFDAETQEQRFELPPYGATFGGEIRVATADVTGDNVPDIITGAGPEGGPHVKVFDGATGIQIRSFHAFDPEFRGGVYVAGGDVDGDGKADIIVGSGPGIAPSVRVFSGENLALLHDIVAYDTAFFGGVRVAAGDINGDGLADIITGAGTGGGPHVRVFDGESGDSLSGGIASFFAFAEGFTGGVFVAAGDVNQDGQVDVIASAGPGGGPHVRVFDGRTSTPNVSLISGHIGNFYAFDETFRGGVRVAAGDLNGDGQVELILAAGPGGGPHVRAVTPVNAAPVDLFSFYAFDPSFTGGVFVAGDTLKPAPPGEPLRLSNDATPTGNVPSLEQTDLGPIFAAALDRFEHAGVSSETIGVLRQLDVQIADLPNGLLGVSLPGRIVIDTDAGGVGWYIDATPETDEEFHHPLNDRTSNRIDLLSVVLHELGHQLGGEHLDSREHPDHFLSNTLSPGERRVPTVDDLDFLFSDPSEPLLSEL